MLSMLQAMLAGGQIPHAARIVGQVKYGNDASARAFERCGFLRKDLPGRPSQLQTHDPDSPKPSITSGVSGVPRLRSHFAVLPSTSR